MFQKQNYLNEKPITKMNNIKVIELKHSRKNKVLTL